MKFAKFTIQLGALVLLLLLAAATRAQQPPGLPAQQAAGGSAASAGEEPSADSPPRKFSALDVLAPMSHLRLGPFAIYSASIMGGYSNYPAMPGLDQNALLPAEAITSVGMLTVNVSMGLSKRWKKSAFGLSYSPSMYYDTASLTRQVNSQSGSMNYSATFGRAWDFSLTATAGTFDQYSTLFQAPPLERVTQLQVPLSNPDLMSMVFQPVVYTPPLVTFSLQAHKFLRASGNAALSRRLGQRNSVGLSLNYSLNRGLDDADSAALLLSNLQTRGASLSLDFTRQLSRRLDLGARVSEQRTGVHLNDQGQRQAQLTVGWRPGRRWSFSVAAGPAIRYSLAQPNFVTLALSGQVARNLGSGMVSASFSKDLYLASLVPGGTEARQLMVDWSPQSRRHRYSYSLSGGYSWIVSSAQSATSMQGWTARPSIGMSLNRTVGVYAQYVFFRQRYDRPLAGGLFATQRHMALAGLRFNFVRPWGR